MKKEIQQIYDDSKQNYGAPKIAQELRKSGEIVSTRTVGKYMREMGIMSRGGLNFPPPASFPQI
jgi:repressor of nif and glnA expression